MVNAELLPVTSDEQIIEIESLADRIWHNCYTEILSSEQIAYMLGRFLSRDAVSEQIRNGYEYYLVRCGGGTAGFFGFAEENGGIFLSKLYLLAEYRGKHLAGDAIAFLKSLCRKRHIPRIRLTCNKYNKNALAVYRHLGFVTVDSVVNDIGQGYVMDDYIMELSVSE